MQGQGGAEPRREEEAGEGLATTKSYSYEEKVG